MNKTSIQWTNLSVNPIRARDPATNKVGHYCEKLSPGCAHCYSSAMQRRFGLPEFPGRGRREPLPMADDGAVPAPGGLRLFLDPNTLAKVFRRKKPAKIFWCDMTDLFGEWVPAAWVAACWAVMARTPQHTHQVLTKRPERARHLLSDPPPDAGPWPLPNVWLGTSVEDQATADERIPRLLATPAAVRFLSVEPLLGPVDVSAFLRVEELDVIEWGQGPVLGHHRPIHWVIVGGESGPHARPCNVAWVRDLVQQCQDAGVACFVKQLGAHPISEVACQPARGFPLRDHKGGDPAEWPEDIRVRQFPLARKE